MVQLNASKSQASQPVRHWTQVSADTKWRNDKRQGYLCSVRSECALLSSSTIIYGLARHLAVQGDRVAQRAR
jgi:hypothetical protein